MFCEVIILYMLGALPFAVIFQISSVTVSSFFLFAKHCEMHHVVRDCGFVFFLNECGTVDRSILLGMDI